MLEITFSSIRFMIISFNPAQYNFIPNPSPEMEFFPLILTKIEFHPFIRKERYPINNVQEHLFSLGIKCIKCDITIE